MRMKEVKNNEIKILWEEWLNFRIMLAKNIQHSSEMKGKIELFAL